MKDGIVNFLVAVSIILGGFLLGLYYVLSLSFVMQEFYSWFISPIFIDLPILKYYQFIGINMFIGLFKIEKSLKKSIKKEYLEKEDKKVICLIVLNPWIAYLIGYIISHFIC